MAEPGFRMNDGNRGVFFIEEEGRELAQMEVSIADGVLTAHHTEVRPGAEGKGLGKLLLGAMVSHARAHHLKVKPLCSFVHRVFSGSGGVYDDIWIR